jgi:hypothetical protein
MSTLQETLSTPIEAETDVLVVGAGSAGVAAALASARQGLKTTLIDPAGFPGGTMVSGLALIGCWDGEKQIVRGIFQELVDALRQRGGVSDDPTRTTQIAVDAEKLKVIVLEKLAEAGVTMRLHTLLARAVVVDSKIAAVVVEGKGGRRALKAKMFIDATGDADLAYAAGVPVEKGRKSDGKSQSMTLVFGVGNIDKQRFEAAGGYANLEAIYNAVSVKENFRNPRRGILSGIWNAQGREGEYTFNVTRVLNADGSDSVSLTHAEVEGRLQAWEFMDRFLRPHVPGFERAYIVWTAAKVGVRESRRVVGEYVLTRKDIWEFVKFPDVINCGSWPIDIHSPTDETTEICHDHFYGGKYWTIPYRSLVPLKVDNLLVAGRCLSATHEALAAVRVMANTLSMGEAAGYAAALCLKHRVTPRTLTPSLVQALLLKNGGWLGESFERHPGSG